LGFINRRQKRLLARLNFAMLYLRAWRKLLRLPPGKMSRLDQMERSDRRVFQSLAEELGPVFKGTIDGRFAICLVGNNIARRLLRDHSVALNPVTIDVSRLFAGEFMRGMEGDFHKSRRAILIKGLGALNIDVFKPYMQQTIRENLEVYCNAKSSPSRRYDDFYRWSETLSVITSSILIHIVLGAKPGSKQLQDLMNLYRELGPNGVAWNVGDKQVDAYQRIRESLTQNPAVEDANGLIAVLSNQGQVDANLLGNLIYMVETGRYDMRGLFRWISKYAADNPTWIARIRTSDQNQRVIIAKAFVQEVLRLDQSERLMREVSQDIVFEGFLIPKGTLLRICMWEAHKDDKTFEDPFAFRPERFLGKQTFGERFSPFGLDQHLCPFANFSINLASIFLIELASNFEICTTGGEPAVRGPYHWEPAPDFSVRLTQIEKT
jgi:cytochrome P450